MARQVLTSGNTAHSYTPMPSAVITHRTASAALGIAVIVVGVLLFVYGCAAPPQRSRSVLPHRSTTAAGASSINPAVTTVADDSLWYLTPQIPTVMEGLRGKPEDRGPLGPLYPANAWREVESPNCERAKRASEFARSWTFCNTPR